MRCNEGLTKPNLQTRNEWSGKWPMNNLPSINELMSVRTEKGVKSRANEYNTDINHTVTTIDRTNVENVILRVKHCEDTKQDQSS